MRLSEVRQKYLEIEESERKMGEREGGEKDELANVVITWWRHAPAREDERHQQERMLLQRNLQRGTLLSHRRK